MKKADNTFDFNKFKYHKELLIDCGQISKTPHFVTDHQPFYITFHEVFFILKGKGVFRLDEEEIPYQAGTVLLLPPNKWRQWQTIEEPIDGYFLIFEEEFIATFFKDPLFLYRFHYFYNTQTPSYIQSNAECFEKMVAKIVEIQTELNHLKADSHHFLRSLLYYLLIQINRVYEADFKIEQAYFREDVPLRFRRLLEKYIRKEHQAKAYAAHLQVSKSHLNKLLQQYFGKSSAEMIKERLLSEVKRELLFSDQTIAEISYTLGFSEPANCNRFFKNMTGWTPRQYRQQYAK